MTPTIGLLLQAVIVLVILGVVLYLLETYIPISPPIQIVIRLLVVLALALWLLRLFGIAGPLPTLRT